MVKIFVRCGSLGGIICVKNNSSVSGIIVFQRLALSGILGCDA